MSNDSNLICNQISLVMDCFLNEDDQIYSCALYNTCNLHDFYDHLCQITGQKSLKAFLEVETIHHQNFISLLPQSLHTLITSITNLPYIFALVLTCFFPFCKHQVNGFCNNHVRLAMAYSFSQSFPWKLRWKEKL